MFPSCAPTGSCAAICDWIAAGKLLNGTAVVVPAAVAVGVVVTTAPAVGVPSVPVVSGVLVVALLGAVIVVPELAGDEGVGCP
jgi:hypothetical protein